jgi:small GTP-binding protein
MAIPHIVFKQLAKKRLVGKEGKERSREIQKLLSEMPGYKTGPYGEIRKWLKEEIQETVKRRQAKAKLFFDVKKEGDAQIVLLGPPNIGKSSLLKKLSSIQIKVANYAFTTLKPIPAIVDFGGALIQIVEIPGLLQGASEGRGGGKAMLAAARNADYLVLMTSVDTPVEKAVSVYKEMEQSGLPTPAFLICNKMDLPNAQQRVTEIKQKLPNLEIVLVSVEQDASLEVLKDRLWQELHLIRVFLRNRSSGKQEKPIVVPQGSTVEDVIEQLPKSIGKNFRSAKIWGSSTKFDGQQVGESHILFDGDILEAH